MSMRGRPFALIKDHVLLKYAGLLEEADAEMTARIGMEKVAEIVQQIPDCVACRMIRVRQQEPSSGNAYLNFFALAGSASSSIFVREAMHARAAHL